MRSDTAFPYLEITDRFRFPPPDGASPEGIVAVGGNLSPGMLLSAYTQGIFPWFSPGDPILWWSPDPRFVLFPDEMHVSRSLKRFLRRCPFRITADTEFEAVIRACAEIPRPGQPGTWITTEMIGAYCELHRLGYAHSIEVRRGCELVGGLYGVAVGSVFCGESMFSRESNASKTALAVSVPLLHRVGLTLVDCQIETDHMVRFGAHGISRHDYLSILKDALRRSPLPPDWTGLFSANAGTSSGDTYRCTHDKEQRCRDEE